ncbi:MAG: phage recombination protein Bet [Candidatus Aminicenantes bacterium]|nr:phage recombination protein Bet [Candidatus Aminicenantes bacterium]
MENKKKDSLMKEESKALMKVTAETIKKYICPDATDQEIELFKNQCKMFQLNPFKREIYLIKYASYPADIVVGYQVYLKRADRSKQWDGMESGTKGSLKKKDLVGWVKVYRKDWKRPLCHEVDFEEYAKRRKDGSLTKFWAKMPKTMIKKVAVSQGYRLAFPDEMGDLPYIVEEIEHVREQELPDASERFTEENQDSKENEEKADARAEKAHISNYQVTEISRLEVKLVDRYALEPEDLLKQQLNFADKKVSDFSLNEADEWISILTKLLKSEMEKEKKVEDEKKAKDEEATKSAKPE